MEAWCAQLVSSLEPQPPPSSVTASPNEYPFFGLPPLHLALLHNKPSAVPPNNTTMSRAGLVLCAARSMSVTAVKLALRLGGSCSETDGETGVCALDVALESRQWEMADVLCRATMHNLIGRRAGRECQIEAVAHGSLELAKALLQHSPILGNEPIRMQACLAAAANTETHANIELLVSRLKTVPAGFLTSLLNRAAEVGALPVARYLCQFSGVDGTRAVFMASSNGHENIISAIFSAKIPADFNHRDSEFGWTPIEMAVIRGHDLAGERLATCGVKVPPRSFFRENLDRTELPIWALQRRAGEPKRKNSAAQNLRLLSKLMLLPQYPSSTNANTRLSGLGIGGDQDAVVAAPKSPRINPRRVIETGGGIEPLLHLELPTGETFRITTTAAVPAYGGHVDEHAQLSDMFNTLRFKESFQHRGRRITPDATADNLLTGADDGRHFVLLLPKDQKEPRRQRRKTIAPGKMM